MSRIGKLPITVPAGVTVTVDENNLVTVKGPKGTLSQQVNPDITIKQEGNVLTLERPSDSKPHKAMHGLYRALVNNGVLCLIPHTVALEFPALILPLLGYKTTWVTSRIKNPALSKLILRHRESTGTHDLVRHRCYDRLVELLRDGECVIMMSDHDSRNTRGEFVDFLGIEAYTPTGCARLAADTGAAVVPMFAMRGPDGKYTFAIWPELPALCAPDGSYDILANMKQQNDAFSRIITENPDQWIWFHKRWRTTPESLERFLKSKGKTAKR